MFAAPFAAPVRQLGLSNNQYFEQRPLAVPHTLDIHLSTHDCILDTNGTFTHTFESSVPAQPRALTLTAVELDVKSLATIPPNMGFRVQQLAVAVPPTLCSRDASNALTQLRQSPWRLPEPQKVPQSVYASMRAAYCEANQAPTAYTPLAEEVYDAPTALATMDALVADLNAHSAWLQWNVTDAAALRVRNMSQHNVRITWADQPALLARSLGAICFGVVTQFTDLAPGDAFTCPRTYLFPVVRSLYVRINDHGQPRTHEVTTMVPSAQYHPDVLARVRVPPLSRSSAFPDADLSATRANGLLSPSLRQFAAADNNRPWTTVSCQFLDDFGNVIVPRHFVLSLACETL